MKFFATLLAICMSLTLVVCQPYLTFPGAFSYNPFGAASTLSQNTIRDARNDRGPVLFPPSPSNQFDETSGVIVGASGYGFVPPQQQRYYYSRC